MKVFQKGLCFNLYYYNMTFNKPKHIKEPHRVGKPSESLKFKNNLNKKLNNSAYESIRNIIEEGDGGIKFPSMRSSDHVVSQPQLQKQNNDHFKSHKKYNNNNKSK